LEILGQCFHFGIFFSEELCRIYYFRLFFAEEFCKIFAGISEFEIFLVLLGHVFFFFKHSFTGFLNEGLVGRTRGGQEARRKGGQVVGRREKES
jgi:hypothetical protein